ncbi:uncharacterized protein LOC134855423 [Symsagittifera roscoffensis]|uniref:uncharacterized protein LOC134855423 n=1 Tax=Symsagittifera roscoffensis TaxID=84072 RepID=UPI00307B54D7
MHYNLIIFLSGAFVVLLVFTIGQQIRMFLEKQNNPVSSINVIYNPEGHHESSVAMMTAMILSQRNNSRIAMDFTEYHITDKCLCLNRTRQVSSGYVNCTNLLTLNHNSSVIGSNTLLWETPVWQNQTEAIFCDHPKDKPVVFILIVLNQTFTRVKQLWDRSTQDERLMFVDDSFEHNMHTWVHCNFYNKLRLSRVEYYEEHKPQKIQISVDTSTAENVIRGQTRMLMEWRESFVNRIDRFREQSIWSFALLLCSVILGLERCYAIMTRAKVQREKMRKKSLAVGLEDVHAKMDV